MMGAWGDRFGYGEVRVGCARRGGWGRGAAGVLGGHRCQTLFCKRLRWPPLRALLRCVNVKNTWCGRGPARLGT
eukprot:6756693-Pyramimonas_sp.AAC.1